MESEGKNGSYAKWCENLDNYWLGAIFRLKLSEHEEEIQSLIG